MGNTIQDLVVIGGGINGVGIAADAAGRGLSVTLIEASDLASATSSWSSKLIHGGLRYLEHYEFRLVKEALAEREVLLKMAPHLVTPLRFKLPHHSGLRPGWMIRTGLFLYDHLSKRVSLQASKGIRFNPDKGPLHPTYTRGFEYSDCRVDDARLVIMNAKLAEQKGAQIVTRQRVTSAVREGDVWLVEFENQQGVRNTLRAKALVNAAGPWVSQVLSKVENTQPGKGIRLVKGSHIIVPKIHAEEEAYILQNQDGRIVFVIPYLDDYSLIGTTDVDYVGDPRHSEIDDDEIDYLIRITRDYFTYPLTRNDIVWTYSGVRPLMQGEREEGKAAAKVTRDYHFEVEDRQGQAPLLSVFGGKLTTYRKLAEAAVNALQTYFPEAKPSWTNQARLPGAEGVASPEAYAIELKRAYPFLDTATARRLASTYGSLAKRWLANAHQLSDLGRRFGPLFEKEVRYLIEHEWAMSLEDVIWRRTKTGIGMTADVQKEISEMIQTYLGVGQSEESGAQLTVSA
ncbi:glycerol-3-phosphate dehydrogenase [Nitrincola tibetensis]|uniref:Glycerol-3-phosphate dehydrogenase n=1 Tax=Nitrincola tibetensis TaxID=2219697 RepID=A0A364NPA1_9GAMM|nr:glycerol-3-phosphate dehydrogenase [Nitrincola tibetensis]RAU18852.1 glycerol-3-phosphate dehydrogenase [Nitrincola tibetensis]